MSEVTKYRFSFDDGLSELSLDGLLTNPAEMDYVSLADYAELEAENHRTLVSHVEVVGEMTAVMQKKEATIKHLRELLKESQRCLQIAKSKWAPHTTNSDADMVIARNAVALDGTP